MPLRMVKKNRSEQSKQLTQAMATPAPALLGAGKSSKKTEEPKSPSERSDESKAKIREARMSTKTKRYGERYTPGMLIGGQAKLDKNKNNKIDAEDFKILKAEKKGKPMKAALGAIALGIGAKKLMDKNKMSMPAGMGAAALLAKKKKDILGKKRGGGIKKDPTKTVNPFEKKGSKFMERRKKLGRAGSLLGKAGRIGLLGAALGVAGAGAAKLGQTIGRKMSEKKKKMKGDVEGSTAPYKKMGGGMMKKPMGYKKGKEIDYGKVFDKKFYSSALGKEAQLHADDYDAGLDRAERRAASETMALMKKNKKMGGGMMMKPMGYKSGKSVKAKCKLGRNKPTKMY